MLILDMPAKLLTCFRQRKPQKKSAKINGFTLIEIMVVVVIIGLMASFVRLGVSANSPEKTLKKVSLRFVSVFSAATEYGLLNNVELGIVIKKDSYQFVGYDGVKWSSIPEQDWLNERKLIAGVVVTLTLDDLPIEQPQLFDSSVFTEQEDDFTLDSDEQKAEKIQPQIYLLSGGDITPFRLTFFFSDNSIVGQSRADNNVSYQITAVDGLPLHIEGPLSDG